MRQKQRGPGALRRATEAGPELSRAACSSFSNISIELSAQHGRRPAGTRNTPSWRRLGELTAEAVADIRLRRDVARLHRLGARPLYELLVELGAKHMIRAAIEERVARYADLDPTLLRELGGNIFAASPLRRVT
jgi:hypothetical protein